MVSLFVSQSVEVKLQLLHPGCVVKKESSLECGRDSLIESVNDREGGREGAAAADLVLWW